MNSTRHNKIGAIIVLLALALGQSKEMQGLYPKPQQKAFEERVITVFNAEIAPELNRALNELKMDILQAAEKNMGNMGLTDDPNAKESPFLKSVSKTIKMNEYVGELPKEIQTLIQQNRLENKEYFDRFEVKLPRAILFTGPPGTGKTLLARIMAAELGFPFYVLHNVVGQYHGQSEQQLNQAFQVAKNIARDSEHKTIILFIDEIDHIGRKRGDDSHFSLHNGTVTALLTQIDGISSKESALAGSEGLETEPRIIVIGATNHPKALDPALESRFNNVITIPLPDQDKREQLLQMYVKGNNIPVSSDIDFKQYAYALDGLSARDINTIAMEARKIAAFAKAQEITDGHLEEAIVKNFGKVVTSLKKGIFSLTNKDIFSVRNMSSTLFID